MSIEPGHFLFPSAELVADPSLADGWGDELSVFHSFGTLSGIPGELTGPGQPGCDVLFLLGEFPNDDSRLMALRIGERSTEAVANHMPAEIAEKVSKPKAIYVGGRTSSALLVLAQLAGSDQTTVLTWNPETQNFFEAEAAETGQDSANHRFDKNTISAMRVFAGVEILDREYVETLLGAGLLDTTPADFRELFHSRPEETWRHVMAQQPYPANLMSTWITNPQRN